jgi:hypothetical protein
MEKITIIAGQSKNLPFSSLHFNKGDWFSYCGDLHLCVSDWDFAGNIEVWCANALDFYTFLETDDEIYQKISELHIEYEV